jgi:hypothetical protein
MARRYGRLVRLSALAVALGACCDARLLVRCVMCVCVTGGGRSLEECSCARGKCVVRTWPRMVGCRL